ncbi:MAG: riboflavin biosynthesis protein RibF [Opitutales bacterium]
MTAPLHIALGAFDGVHLGHRAVLRSARACAERDGGTAAAMTYEPHPSRFLRPDSPVPRILSPRQNEERLLEAGAAYVHRQAFDAAHAAIEAADFPAWLRRAFPALSSLHVGENFRYGRGRAGDDRMLAEHGRLAGFEVRTVPAVRLADDTVSSSRIRQALAAGELELANAMLLRPYEAEGQVVAGRGLGRTIGFPTANIAWEPELRPAFGVYAVEVVLGGEALPAVANYGLRPTVESAPVAPLLEAHVLRGDAPTTGDAVRVRWVRRLRAEQKFADLAALQAQIAKDSAQAKQALGLLG